MRASKTAKTKWLCRCTRCTGVWNARDAVQEAFKWALGGAGVPVVVSVCRSRDNHHGHVFCDWAHWHDEPDVFDLFEHLLIRVVSFRPGRGTAPTEGDVARWIRWQQQPTPPDDWLIADGTRLRSVADTVRSLQDRTPMPDEDEILGDWYDPSPEKIARRERMRREWSDIKARHAARDGHSPNVFAMAKGNKDRRHRRVPVGPRTIAGYHPRVERDEEPELLRSVRGALRGESPLDLLMLVSTLLVISDPRAKSPFEPAGTTTEPPLLGDLVQSFIEVDCRETSALLIVLAALVDDELLVRRIWRALSERRIDLPIWLPVLGQAELTRVVELVHVLGDGDDIMLGVRITPRLQLTVIVYIDHNLGGIVKDAFVVDRSIDDTLAWTERNMPADQRADSRIDALDPADARARITEGVAGASITFPPFESETWPACRALVEWAVRMLPEGGTGYEHPEWDDTTRAEVAARFFASPFGASLDDPEHRDLVETLLVFATDYGPGDPLRWSPVAVEIVLVDWIPRKLIAPADYLAKAPAVLRALIRHAHAERGIRASLTSETLAAVDRFEPEYRRLIRSERPRRAEALLAGMGVLEDFDDEGEDRDPGDLDLDIEDLDALLARLRAREVGGEDALRELDDVPLPDEPFDWKGIDDPIVRAHVEQIVTLADGCCDALLDVEHRTACRRFVARVAARDPAPLVRGRTERAAAAVCWIIARVNRSFSQQRGGLTSKALHAHFGITGGDSSQRAGTLLAAGGFVDARSADVTLGSADFLVARRRAQLLGRSRWEW